MQTGPQQQPGEGPLPAAQAVEQLIHDYSKLVYHLIHGMTGSEQESQDLTQNVFMRAFEGIDRARAATGPCFQARPWLLRIASNEARMYLRRRRLYQFVPFSGSEGEQDGNEQAAEVSVQAKAAPVQPPGYATPEAANPAEIVAERDAVSWSLAQLPETLRLPLLLSLVAGCSHAEIARILALQEATVRQRISRARKAFQAFYMHASGEEIRADTLVQHAAIHDRKRPRPALRWQAASG